MLFLTSEIGKNMCTEEEGEHFSTGLIDTSQKFQRHWFGREKVDGGFSILKNQESGSCRPLSLGTEHHIFDTQDVINPLLTKPN